MPKPGPANTTFLANDNDGRGQMIRMKVGTTDRLALFCVSAVGAALAVVGGAVRSGPEVRFSELACRSWLSPSSTRCWDERSGGIHIQYVSISPASDRHPGPRVVAGAL